MGALLTQWRATPDPTSQQAARTIDNMPRCWKAGQRERLFWGHESVFRERCGDRASGERHHSWFAHPPQEKFRCFGSASQLSAKVGQF
jgi:hypothetical protein